MDSLSGRGGVRTHPLQRRGWTEIEACWGIYGIDEAITLGATTLTGVCHPR